ncbi:MAG: GTP-binding protein Der [Peptococcaceae bacterium BRH_c4a]|nr:MAG: GTP-binding protein Der [Peptococcaceae bacterium BRH_c4a]
MPKPIVAIVGRPNVGKSTLFNRIVGGRLAIVEGIPGVTRDRLYQDAEWIGRKFTLVDTGGLDFFEDNALTSNVRKQAQLAIDEADVIIFVVDARAGITSNDEEVAGILRKAEKPLVLVANKVEQYDGRQDFLEFYSLGLGEPIPVSAAEGLNTGDMMDAVVNNFPVSEEIEEDRDSIRIAVIGRPNVGKSSLVNKILGQERVIVSDIPGTTRDAIDTLFVHGDRRYILVDTAGMRRKSRIELSTEKFSVIRSLRAVDRSDVVLMLIDAVDGVTEQDKKIAGYAHDQGKSSIIAVNKWDLIKKDDRTSDQFTTNIREELGFMKYSPVVFVSALTGQRVTKILQVVDTVAENYSLRVSTPGLNNLIRECMLQNPPPSHKTKRLKIYYASQNSVKPPKFTFYINDPDLAHFSYIRYLENQIRSAFGFQGTPIKILLRRKNEKDAAT